MPTKTPEIHRPRLPVLVINSYAGSLMVAAAALEHKVIGSYEDKGYGIKIQQANFLTEVDYRAKRSEWPAKQDLSKAIVIAHPPCSAFSIMNTTGSKTKRGLDAEKFACTVDVLRYGMENGAMGIAVESVIPTMEGARDVHESWARDHGYHVFRVLQNSITFGVPQWRERFWCIFVRKDLLSRFVVNHVPVPVSLRDVLGNGDEECNPVLVRKYNEQKQILVKEFGRRTANKLLTGGYGYQRVGPLLRNYLTETTGEKHDALELGRKYAVWGRFHAQTLHVLNPDQWAPTLLGTSFWASPEGRPLSDKEYMRIMGFPDDYIWPGKTINQMRGFLSRGVCPPVAVWILDQLERNLNNSRALYKVRGKSLKDHSVVISPGGVADLRPNKVLWNQVLTEMRRVV